MGVSLELSISTASYVGDDTFAPTDHLLCIVQGVVKSRANTRIVLPGKGEVAIFPARGEYYADIQDMVEFCRTPATEFESILFGEAAPQYAFGSGRNIKDLLWQAAFHASQGRLAEGCSKYDVVQLRHWPNLTRLPATPNAARICALLTRYPTTIMLVHRMLGIGKEEVYQIYSAAHSAGITNMISHGLEITNLKAGSPQPERTQDRGLFRSLFAKISGL